jgi:hypothetical protein
MRLTLYMRIPRSSVWLDTSNDELKVPKFENSLILKVVRITRGQKISNQVEEPSTVTKAPANPQPVAASKPPTSTTKPSKLI